MAQNKNSLCRAKQLGNWDCGRNQRVAAWMANRIFVIISKETLSTPVEHPLGIENFFEKNFVIKWGHSRTREGVQKFH
jgi:hypothetical protein